MSFKQQNVVVLGASGVVGSGIVRRYLDAGATVAGVSRSAANLERLEEQMKIRAGEPFLKVVGDFKDSAAAQATYRAVSSALKDRPIDHVVSVLGFVAFSPPPTAAPVDVLMRALDDGLYNNYLAAQVFIPGMKARPSSFTLVSGGLAHIPPPNVALWPATVKNAALNALTLALAAETASDQVRVNTMCIHLGVAPAGGNKNQLGMTAEGDTLRLAPAFLGVARGSQKGQVLCLSSWASADALGSER